MLEPGRGLRLGFAKPLQESAMTEFFQSPEGRNIAYDRRPG
jgi:hypothetical protein